MLFNSWQFAVFFPIIFFIYFLVPHKYRWCILLVASYYFYMCWDAKLILLIIITTLVHYFAALWIENLKGNERIRKLVFITSIAFSIGILFFYKYLNFFTASIAEFFRLIAIPFDPITLKIALPLGISFYTFQTLSYTIDVYRGSISPEKHFGYFALYISFFPRLVAGPIERSKNLLPQFKGFHNFDYDNAVYGLKLMAIGFFKKLVVADTLAKGVNAVYNNVTDYSGCSLVIATVLFALQIYCDFSGYSDIAIGCARTMGINLTQNFNSPYLSSSFQEFWRRWHITLSTWFRDYVYIPLGGNHVSKSRNYFNLMITFLLSGLWHGAAWTFIIWGGLHGIFQVIEKAIKDKTPKIIKSSTNSICVGMKRFSSITITFAMITFAWIFFRASSITDAIYVIQNMFTGITEPVSYFSAVKSSLNISDRGIFIIVFEISLLLLIDIMQNKVDIIRKTSGLALPIRWSIYLAFCCIIVVLSSKGTTTEFIYIQF